MPYITYTAKRSLVGSGSNIASGSPETFASGTWVTSGGTIVTSADYSISPPDENGYAAKFIEDTTSGPHGIQHTLTTTLTDSTYHTFSIYAQASERSWMRITVTNKNGVSQSAYYNVSSGTTGTVNSGVTADITDVGSLWYRAIATINIVSGATVPVFAVRTASDDNVSGHTGVASSGMFWWGAMINIGQSATNYPHTVDKTYTLEFDLLGAQRGAKFTLSEQTSIGGNKERIFDREEVYYSIKTSYYNENTMKSWREFFGSVAAAESFVMDLYGTVDSAQNARSYILDSASYEEARRGSLFLYSVDFRVREA